MLEIEEGKISQLEIEGYGTHGEGYGTHGEGLELMRNHMNEMKMKMKEFINWECCVGVFGVVLMAIVIGLCIWK